MLVKGKKIKFVQEILNYEGLNEFSHIIIDFFVCVCYNFMAC